MRRILLAIIVLVLSNIALADEKILNLYTWSGVIPDFIIRQFEKETGIKVNFSTYDSNEVMYAKLKIPVTMSSSHLVIILTVCAAKIC